MSQSKLLSAEAYHDTNEPTYLGQDGSSFKVGDDMARVLYEPSHHNPKVETKWQGHGKTIGKWVYNEEPAKAEGLLSSCIELFMDSELEPNASIGMHSHSDTEEIYYLLEGSLDITLVYEGGMEETRRLGVGDSHRIGPGQSHFIQALDQGARIIVVSAKAPPRHR